MGLRPSPPLTMFFAPLKMLKKVDYPVAYFTFTSHKETMHVDNSNGKGT